MKTRWLKLSALSACLLACAWGVAPFGVTPFNQDVQAQQKPKDLPKHPTPPVIGDDLVVQLCDGITFLQLKGVAPGTRLTAEQAQGASDQLMSMWLAKQPKEVAEAWAR